MIEEAIALASGAKRAQVVKRARAGVTALEKAADEERRKARRQKSERQKQARAARKAAVEAVFATPIDASPPPIPASSGIPLHGALNGVPGNHPGTTPDFLSAYWVDKFGHALCVLIAAVFVPIAMFRQFPREIEAARKAAIRQASPSTAWAVFAANLQERIEKRLKRAEADKLRKRRAQRTQNEFNHPSGSGVQKRTRGCTLGNDDAQKVACEPDAPACVANADEVAAAELMPADEGE